MNRNHFILSMNWGKKIPFVSRDICDGVIAKKVAMIHAFSQIYMRACTYVGLAFNDR